MADSVSILDLGEDRQIAFARLHGSGPEVVFLGGFASDMTGTKALWLEDHCKKQGRAFCRLDYRGHGQSSGRFADGTIGDWASDALAVLDQVITAPVVLVGSSMGGWIMVLIARQRPERVRGLVGIASAPDFTALLLEPSLSGSQRAALDRDGRFDLPSEYGEPLTITRRLIEEGRSNLVLGGPIAIGCPVHLLHGQEDPDVPWTTSLDLAARLESPHVTAELIKDGDHRLSRDSDLKRIGAALDRILEQC